ncbi:hypothetical protein [Sphingosinithalassobacter sp. CS137]|uniref:hypothetical protein n=1 Tax=Sphingosinithalassobacter sp. CS137 TaxID=2762748 RepID=UPI00165E12FE|nr:hypothetical protein [Sphingosinithalassobacter sp. CS137]
MTDTPPVPNENKSPYPIEEAPHAGGGEAISAAKDAKESRARGLSATTLGVGAAVGIGSAAIVAALLYARSGRKNGEKS